jgi:hypothetical protein
MRLFARVRVVAFRGGRGSAVISRTICARNRRSLRRFRRLAPKPTYADALAAQQGSIQPEAEPPQIDWRRSAKGNWWTLVDDWHGWSSSVAGKGWNIRPQSLAPKLYGPGDRRRSN